MPPEPAPPLSAEAPSHRRPKTSFWQLHSAKGKSPRAANNSPNAPRLRKATQAIFAPGPLLSRGHSGARLPLASWALLLCWGSPAPESHSRRVLLGREAGLGARKPSRPTPQPCSLSQLGRTARGRLNGGPKRASGGCIRQRESLLGQPTTAPTRLGSGKQCKPFSLLALCSPEGTAGRGCPWLPGPSCFAGGVRCLKPTPHRFSLAGKHYWAREGLLRPGHSHVP